MSTISICVLFPDLLGTYGDGGNAVVLQRRAERRGIGVDVVPVSMGASVPVGCDIYLLGGGEDQPQSAVTTQLTESKALHKAVDNGAAVLAVCAGMQVLGTEFAVAGDKSMPGLGLLDVTTVRGAGARRVGELTSQPHVDFGTDLFTGYENHGGVTKLGADATPLGIVITGHGNDDGAGTEGAVQGRIIGTYMHGPALARNPAMADKLLSWAVGKPLDPLDDTDVHRLREERLAASERNDDNRESTLVERLLDRFKR